MGRTVYKDNWLTVEKVGFKINGKKVEYTKTTEADVAVVVPILWDGKLLLEKQFRHIINKDLIEFPAGHVEKGENPLKAARRELEEETGMKAGKMKLMFEEYSNPGMAKRRFYYFLATGLKDGNMQWDETEKIGFLKLAPQTVEKMIKSGEIKDHKTISAYLYYKLLK